MKIISAKDYAELSKKAADIVAEQLKAKPDSVLGLATGSSPVGLYKELIARYEAGELDFAPVHSVNLDEYVGLGPDHDQSYRYFMNDNLFNHVNILPENTNVPNGLAPDLDAECLRYEGVIAALGGIDLQVLGIGHDGHIAFNEPDSVFPKITHSTGLTEMTVEANKRFFAKKEDVPRQALTMGIGSIMKARKIIMVANGAGKAEVLAKAFKGPVTPEVPASILQFHPDFTLIADEEALSVLNG